MRGRDLELHIDYGACYLEYCNKSVHVSFKGCGLS
jgi:hypothetical protein